MDKAFRYTEHDRRGHDQVLSMPANKQGAIVNTTPAELIPRPALVDLDSTIHIRVLNERLNGVSGGSFLEDSTELLDRKDQITQVLNKVGPVVEAQQAATEAYASSDDEEFVRLRRVFGIKASELLVELFLIWPDENDPQRIALEDAAEEVPGDPYPGIRRFLNDELRSIDRADRALEDQAMSDSITLRLQAWLESPEKQPVPIHLEGYDDLDRGQLLRRDRWGIDLTEEDIQRLQTHFNRTQEVAAAANAVLDKDKTVGEALLDIAPTLSRELGEIAILSKRLADRFEADDLDARMDRIQVAAERLGNAIRQDVPGLDRETFTTWSAEFADKLRANIEAPAEIIAAAERVTLLRDDWRKVNATNLSQRVASTLSLFRDLRTDFNFAEPSAVGNQISESLEEFLEQKEVELTADVMTTLENVVAGDPARELRKEIEHLYNDVRQVQTIGLRIKEVLEPAKVTLTESAYVPEVRKVPTGDVEDTFIELGRTGRSVGDTVTVKATRFVTEQGNEREAGTTSASFEVSKFGWYAELSPSVVLAKPSKLVSGNDGFRFAPTLSWITHYAPPPYETGGVAETVRALRPGIGIHTAFLNFDLQDSQSIQVGLGVTASLWQNRLQFGAGYNLMSESSDDGRYYVFIGSDLIGILQTLGLTNP